MELRNPACDDLAPLLCALGVPPWSPSELDKYLAWDLAWAVAVRDWECAEVFVMRSVNWAALACSAKSLASIAVAWGALTVSGCRAC